MGRVARIQIEGEGLSPRELQFLAALVHLRIDLTRGLMSATRGSLADTPEDDRTLAEEAEEFVRRMFPDLKIQVLSGIG